MRFRLPRISLPALLVSAPVTGLWGSHFVCSMVPLSQWSLDYFVNLAVMLAVLIGGFLAVALLCIFLIEKLAPGPSSRTRRLTLPLLIAVALLTLPLAGSTGLRLGGWLGLQTGPAQDLRLLPAVARIAHEGTEQYLEKADWPASLAQWDIGVHWIKIIPGKDTHPAILLRVGSRGTRFHSIIIDPGGLPENTLDESFTEWTQGVWLGRRHDL